MIAAVNVKDRLTEATLKTVDFTRSALMSEPANPAYPLLVFNGPQHRPVGQSPVTYGARMKPILSPLTPALAPLADPWTHLTQGV